jgi:hypothetical protein
MPNCKFGPHLEMQQFGRLLVLLGASFMSQTCFQAPRAVVPMKLQRARNTPRDANVVVDEEYVGPLYLVAAQGLRLPVGKHRVTVTRDGYFPWDRLVEADRRPLELAVELVPIPE